MGVLPCKKLGVRGKFISIISLLTLIILTAITLNSMTLTNHFLSRQAATFIDQLRDEQAREEELLRNNLLAKGALLADLLVKSATEPMLNYDFDPLPPLAANAEKDKNINSVVFFDEKGQPLTAANSSPDTTHLIKRDIVFNSEVLGRMEIDLNFDPVDEEIAALAGRIETLITATETGRQQAGEKILLQVITVSLAGVFALCLMIYLLFSRTIITPLCRDMELAKAIRQGDFTRRLTKKSEDEMGYLTLELNRMAEGLEEKAHLAETIAAGDLSVEVPLSSDKDLFGQSLQKMVGNLRTMVGETQVAAEQIATGASQVSDSSQSLSSGATEQACSMEQITSTMVEMGSQTKLNAENAAQASQLSLQARQDAESCNEKMHELINAMGEIKVSGQNISRIIKVIDEIAFQTNLLALNAAVEAARAGSHGKGFAVVAEEVRNLASRSAKAAQETSELIETSAQNAINGATIADRTAAALNTIVAGVAKVTDLVTEIADASSEQAQGISQINQGLGQIDQVTQQNSSNAEQSAAASQELSGMSAHLMAMLARFKLTRSGELKMSPAKDQDQLALTTESF